MRFSEQIGQQQVAAEITGYGERLPHAMMISGPQNVSLLPFGLAVAQWIMCEGEKTEDACGQCRACKRMQKLIHPDFHLTYPVWGGKMLSETWMDAFRNAVLENPWMSLDKWMEKADLAGKKPNITAEECRNISKQMGMRSYEDGPKIQLIWHAELLAKEGNRLLKLIEEPPDNTYLILLSHYTDRILPTILSRCRLISLRPVDPGQLEQKLIADHGIKPERARELVLLTAGDYGRSLELAGQDGSASSDTWLEWMRVAFQSKGDKLIDFVAGLDRLKREEQKMLLRFGGYFLSEMLRIKSGLGEESRLNEEQRKAARKLGSFMTIESMSEIAKLLEDYSYYIDRNVHGKIMYTNLTLQMRKILTSDFGSKEKNN